MDLHPSTLHIIVCRATPRALHAGDAGNPLPPTERRIRHLCLKSDFNNLVVNQPSHIAPTLLAELRASHALPEADAVSLEHFRLHSSCWLGLCSGPGRFIAHARHVGGVQKDVIFLYDNSSLKVGLPQCLRFPMFSYVQGYPYVVFTAKDTCPCCNILAQMD